MRRWLVLASVGAVAVMLPSHVIGHGNQPGEATLAFAGGNVTVSYVGPSAQGRDVLSLIQPGSYWRMGADRPTILKTDVDLIFGGQTVPAGQYTLVAHYVEEGKWYIVLADGVRPRSWEPTAVVGKAPAVVSGLSTPVDHMSIKLEANGKKGTLILEWGDSRLAAEFSAA